MKRMTKLLSLALCAAVLLSLPALAAQTPLISPAPEATPAVEPMAPFRVWGKVTKLESGSLLITSGDDKATHPEVVVHLPEGVPCVDAVTGLPLHLGRTRHDHEPAAPDLCYHRGRQYPGRLPGTPVL